MSSLVNKISQYSLIFYLFYLLWYKEIAGDILLVLYGGAMLCTILFFLVLHKSTLKILDLPDALKWQYIFGFYCLLTGMLVAKDNGVLIKSLMTYFSFLTICCLICINSNKMKSFEWLFNTMIVISLISYLCIIIAPFDYYNGIIVKTLGEHNNPNTLAVLMIAGIFSLLMKYNGSLKSFFTIVLLYIPFIYTIIQTGSKKGIISGGLLFIMWLYIIRKYTKRNMSKIKKLIININIIFLISVSICYFLYSFIDTAAYQRFEVIFFSNSTLSRMHFYNEAIDFFADSPIVGIGFGQFVLNSSLGKYSHSIYAEVISCTGILGMIIYFYPILKCGKLLLMKAKYNNYQSNVLMALYFIELILGTTNIFIYEPIHMILWTILFYYSQNNIKSIKYNFYN